MMLNRVILSFSILFAMLMSGCASKPKPLYNYGEYSESYYSYKKDMNDEALVKLQEQIENVIANTDDSISNRVPPGMYANLGYIYLRRGDKKNAKKYFILEKETYPEAAHFMDLLLNKINASEQE